MVALFSRFFGKRSVGDSAPSLEESSKPPLEWHEDQLLDWPFSLGGIRLGMPVQDARKIVPEEMTDRTERLWTWGEYGMSSARLEEGRIRELWGTALECGGELIVSQGDPVESLASIELPGEDFGFRMSTEYYRLFKQGPFAISVSIVAEDAMFSPQHREILGSDQVVDKVFQISLRFHADPRG